MELLFLHIHRHVQWHFLSSSRWRVARDHSRFYSEMESLSRHFASAPLDCVLIVVHALRGFAYCLSTSTSQFCSFIGLCIVVQVLDTWLGWSVAIHEIPMAPFGSNPLCTPLGPGTWAESCVVVTYKTAAVLRYRLE